MTSATRILVYIAVMFLQTVTMKKLIDFISVVATILQNDLVKWLGGNNFYRDHTDLTLYEYKQQKIFL